jgi:hypothetical protein
MVTPPTASEPANRTDLDAPIIPAYILGDGVICIEFSHYHRTTQVLQCNIADFRLAPRESGSETRWQRGLFDPLQGG